MKTSLNRVLNFALITMIAAPMLAQNEYNEIDAMLGSPNFGDTSITEQPVRVAVEKQPMQAVLPTVTETVPVAEEPAVQPAAVEAEFVDQATSQNMVDAIAFTGSDAAKTRGTGVAGQLVYDNVSWDEQMEEMPVPAADMLTNAKQRMTNAFAALKNFNWREHPVARFNQVAEWAKKNPLQALEAFVVVAATTYGLYKAVRYFAGKKKTTKNKHREMPYAALLR
jgi:hypothetical protein